MRLTRLRLSQIRQFRGALEIPDLMPGLNLFCGPNEAGKSTIVRAIRAAFLERYRSRATLDLLPHGESAQSCSPTIEIQFEAVGEAHALAKTFFARKRCALTRGGVVLDGEEAEESIARLLGFGYAAKGASRADHWGIPGLLWIQQGDGHRVAEPVGHAADHLRIALESTVGAVASSAGDGVLASLRARRDELLTPGTGRPRGELLAATGELDAVRAQLAALDADIATYRTDVDRLAELRAAQALEERSRPWEAFRLQLDAAGRELAAAEQLQQQLGRTEERSLTLAASVRLLDEQLQAFELQRRQAGQRRADHQTEAAARQAAEAAAARWGARLAEATREARSAETEVAAAETEAVRAALQERSAAAEAEAGRLAAQLEAAGRQAAALDRHQADADAQRVDPALLATLRLEAERLRDREITQRAAATLIRFELLPGVTATLDGQAVAATAEHRITAPVEIELPGIGRIVVVPGANEVAELERQVAAARVAVVATLARLGVASIEEAAARQARHQAALGDARAARQLLEAIAPGGLERLRAGLSSAELTRQSTARQMASLPPPPARPPQALAEARAAHQRALAAQQEAATRHAEASHRLAVAAAREQSAETEARRLQAVIDDPATAAREADRAAERGHCGARLKAVDDELLELGARIRSSRPELLRQDVRRLQASLDQALAARNQRAARIAGLAGGLEQMGAAGLEERRADLAVREQSLARRSAELALRARALDLLVRRMEAKRQALTRRLQAPLQARIDHYLGIMFPTARLALNDDLTPGRFDRGGVDATGRLAESLGFEQLSHGAQEQTALISRLAYADLLKDAGRPTLLILDDALVHSDGARLDGMKRVLFDAATRHQVLLFSCHPERWSGLGAPPREIRSFVEAAVSCA